MADSMWGEVFAGAAGRILVLVAQGGWGWLRDIVDSKRIYQWLKTQQDGEVRVSVVPVRLPAI